jgi:hypothetical protein
MVGTRQAFTSMIFAVASALLVSGPVGAADAPAAKPKDAVKGQAAKTPAAKAPAADVPKLTAAQIVEKHAAARGGAQAWKAVEALQLSGKVEAGKADSYARSRQLVDASKKHAAKAPVAAGQPGAGAAQADGKQVELPFKLLVKRPNLSRMEIEFADKTAVQVYDGTHGWKLRPYLNRTDAEPFTAEETKMEAARGDLGGPLVEAAARGAKVVLEGVERVEGNAAYKLKVTPKSGSGDQHVWIDAKTFLDVKVDGAPRRMNGKMHNVFVYQRDFRPVQGVLIPFLLETAVDGYPETHKMTIEKAAVNPPLDSGAFSKPHA